MEITKGTYYRCKSISNDRIFTIHVNKLLIIKTCNVLDNHNNVQITPEQAEVNADLITEAFNVTNETGFSPRQLAEQNEKLVYELQHTLRMLKTPLSRRIQNIELARINNIEKCLKKVQ